MHWTPEAEQLMEKVPRFVRPMARRAVEKVAHAEGVTQITVSEVRKAMPKRQTPKGQALADLVAEAERMADAATDRSDGHELTVCGGLAGCPLALADTEEAYARLKAVVRRTGVGAAIAERIDGPVLSHSRCKITISTCPNGCSEPQTKDVALVARLWPEAHAEACNQCEAGVRACPDHCVVVDEGGPHVDWSVCVGCGRCVIACPRGGLAQGAAGWDVLVAGRLGRHPRLAEWVNDGPLTLDGALEVAERALTFLIENGEPSERLGAVVERLGMDPLLEACRAG